MLLTSHDHSKISFFPLAFRDIHISWIKKIWKSYRFYESLLRAFYKVLRFIVNNIILWYPEIFCFFFASSRKTTKNAEAKWRCAKVAIASRESMNSHDNVDTWYSIRTTWRERLSTNRIEPHNRNPELYWIERARVRCDRFFFRGFATTNLI